MANRAAAEGVNLWRESGGTPFEQLSRAGGMHGWLTVFLLVAVSGRIIDILCIPFLNHFREVSSSGYAAQVIPSATPAFFDLLASRETIYRTLALLALLGVLSLFAFFLTLLFDAPHVRLISLFALLVQCEAIFVVQESANLVILAVRGTDLINGAVDMLAVPGLDLLAGRSEANPGVTLFLNSFNPFSVWYAATVARGIRSLSGARRCLVIAAFLLILRAGIPALFIGLVAVGRISGSIP